MGAQDVALNSRVNLLSRSAGHSGALRRNRNLRPAPHPVRLKAGKAEIRKQTQKSSSSFGESDGPRLHALEPAMSKRMRWDKATRFDRAQIQSGNGIAERRAGAVAAQEDLEKRAQAEMNRWLRTLPRRERARFK